MRLSQQLSLASLTARCHERPEAGWSQRRIDEIKALPERGRDAVENRNTQLLLEFLHEWGSRDVGAYERNSLGVVAGRSDDMLPGLLRCQRPSSRLSVKPSHSSATTSMPSCA